MLEEVEVFTGKSVVLQSQAQDVYQRQAVVKDRLDEPFGKWRRVWMGEVGGTAQEGD